MAFLKAHWKKLIMVNYEVNPDTLKPYLPVGTELDLYEGKCYVSLVGFLFDETKLLGISIPFHHKFEEVNLRFYVRRFENGNWKRGVVFIKEIVPRFMIAAVAYLVYKEHYIYSPMSHSIKEYGDRLEISYDWKYKSINYSMKAVTENKVEEISVGSIEEFIAEHYWGYTRMNEKTTGEYEVVHTRWSIHPLKSFEVNCDFKALYGDGFAELNSKSPSSVFVPVGSEVEVRKRIRIS